MTDNQTNDSSLPYLFVQETRYFGFFPLVFVDRIINVVNEMIYSSIERFYTLLYSSEEVHKQLSPFQIEEGLSKVLTLMESAVDKNFDLFELFVLKNIFKFPDAIPIICPSTDSTKNEISGNIDSYNSKSKAFELERQWKIKRDHLRDAKMLKNRLEMELMSLNHLLKMASSMIDSWNSFNKNTEPCIDMSSVTNMTNNMQSQLTSAHESIVKIQSMLRNSSNLVKSFEKSPQVSTASTIPISLDRWNTRDSSILESVWKTVQKIATFNDINDVKSLILLG